MCSQSETGIFVSSIHCPHPPLNHQIGHAKLLKKSNHNDMTHHTPKEMTPEPLEIIRGALLQEFVGPELYGGVGGHPYDVDERTAIKSLHAVSCVCLPHTITILFFWGKWGQSLIIRCNIKECVSVLCRRHSFTTTHQYPSKCSVVPLLPCNCRNLRTVSFGYVITLADTPPAPPNINFLVTSLTMLSL